MNPNELSITLTSKPEQIEQLTQNTLKLLSEANFVVLKSKKRHLKGDWVRVYITAQSSKQEESA